MDCIFLVCLGGIEVIHERRVMPLYVFPLAWKILFETGILILLLFHFEHQDKIRVASIMLQYFKIIDHWGVSDRVTDFE